MAENTNKGAPRGKLWGGMNRDTNPIDQPAMTYRYGLNVVNNKELGAISNERGNQILCALPSGFELIGSIVINDSPSDTSLAVFLINEGTNTSEIGKITLGTSTYVTLLNDALQDDEEKFNFSTRFPIEGEYKINATGEVSIYWTDDSNKPRYLNLNNIPVPPFAAHLIDLFPKISKYPQIILNNIRSNGGTLLSGAYQLSIAYMTEDGAVTSYLDVSNPVYINDESEGVANQSTNSWGGLTLNTTEYNGCDGGTGTSKAIVWNINNCDTNYKYILPCVVRTIDQAKDAVTLDRVIIPPTGTGVIVSYSGLEPSVTELVGAVQIPKESYTKAKSVAQVDDVLYWGNLEKNKIDIGYQKYANNIKIYGVQLNKAFEITKNLNISGFGNIDINFTKAYGVDGFDSSSFKGYKRGDVYAFYITWVMKDGSETVAYHIPGRQAVQSNNYRYNAGGSFIMESDDITATTQTSGGFAHPFVNQLAYTSPKPFYFFSVGLNNPAWQTRGLSFWHNQNEFYPSAANDIDAEGNYAGNFEVWDIDPFGNSYQLGGSAGNIHGQNVRHHHFGLPGSGGNYPIHRQNNTWTGPNPHEPGSDQHAMNPQGIRITNVPVPNFIVDKCVAYKIYYLRKGLEDRVSIARGMVQGGRENADNHYNAYGDAFICFPWQALDAQYNATHGCSFFTAQPLDLMQSGDSIASIDYIFKHNKTHKIGGTGTQPGGYNSSRGFSVWAKDTHGNNFSASNSMHLSMDWTSTASAASGSAIKVLKAKSRVPAGAILSATAFSRPVDNEGATGTIAFEMHDKLTFHNNNDQATSWKAPYNSGGGNPWYTSNCINCNPFGGGPGDLPLFKYEFEFMSFKTDVHLLFDKQTDFVYTGYSRDVDLDAYWVASPGVINTGGGYLDRAVNMFANPGAVYGEGQITMGGDVHIGYYSFDKFRKSDHLGGGDHILGGGATNDRTQIFGSWSNNSKDYFWDYAVHVSITEARHNMNMKHANENDQAYYPAFPINHAAIMNHDNAGKGFGIFNRDYLTSNDTRLLRAFDPDDVLQTFTDYPTRMIRSVKYNQSGLEDNFRVYLPEDFRDLPRHRGELWKVKAYNNIVVPHMERALYLTKGKETLKVTDASEAYVGTGDLFEKDPAELLLTDRGHAGTTSQWAAVTSEDGYFFVDKEAGKVFLLGEKLEEISMYGMRRFFMENLNIGSSFSDLPNNFDNPIKNIGLIAAYDPILKRFILTKKDLRPISSFPSTTIYNAEKRWFYDSGDPLNLHAYFEEYMEWTVSYDPRSKVWVSFHSYQPKVYITDLTSFYSYIGLDPDTNSINDRLYEHRGPGFDPNDVGFAGTYYGSTFPWALDIIDNEGSEFTKLFTSISYTVDVIDNFTGGIHTDENPFSMISTYNSYQESSVVATVPANTRRTERTWNFNGFRDRSQILGSNPTWIHPMTHNTGNAVPGLLGMPNVPNSQTKKFMPSINSNFIDTTKDWFEMKKFIDKWLGIRLFSSNNGHNFVSLYSTKTRKKISYR